MWNKAEYASERVRLDARAPLRRASRGLIVLLCGIWLWGAPVTPVAPLFAAPQGGPPSVDAPPEWFFDLAAVYPEERYLAAAGVGATRVLAEQDALARLSQRISVSVSAEREATITLTGEADDQRVSRGVDVQVRSTVSEALEGVSFSAPYHESAQVVHIVATLERAAASQQLGREMESIIDERDLLVDRASEAGAASIERFLLLRAAQVVGRPLPALLTRFAVFAVNPAQVALYRQRMRSPVGELLAETKRQITIALDIDDDTGGVGENAFRAAFSAEGLALSAQGNTVLTGAVSFHESDEHSRYTLVRWNVDVALRDADGRVVRAFSRSGRSAGVTAARATEQARLDIVAAIGELWEDE